MQHQTISKKFLRKTMDEQFVLKKEVDDLPRKRALIDNWVAQTNSERIDHQKEVATQANFLNKIFGDVLGYTYDTHDKWFLHKEVGMFRNMNPESYQDDHFCNAE